MLQVGDVVIVASSGSKSLVGKAAQVKDQMSDTSFGAFLTLFRPHQLIDAKYYGCFFQSRFYRDAISEASIGININNLRREHFEALIFPLPPLPEQQRIAAKLESLLGKIKEAKALLDEIPEILQNFRQTVLSAAWSGRLTEDWREVRYAAGKKNVQWETKPFGQLVKLSANGISKRRGESGNDTIVLRLADFKDGKRVLGNEREIRLTEKEVSKYTLDNGNLLIIRVNGSRGIAGKFIVYRNQSNTVETHCDHFIRLILDNERLDPVYAELIGNSIEGRKYIESVLVTSAGQNTISQSSLFRFSIPVPPLEEQQEIVRRVESIFSKADDLEAQYKEAMVLIESLPEIILAKAFRGELLPQDPNDEPASVLLRRIIESLDKKELIEIQRKCFGLDARNMMNYKEMIA